MARGPLCLRRMIPLREKSLYERLRKDSCAAQNSKEIIRRADSKGLASVLAERKNFEGESAAFRILPSEIKIAKFYTSVDTYSKI